jgi:hypothetical protein
MKIPQSLTNKTPWMLDRAVPNVVLLHAWPVARTHHPPQTTVGEIPTFRASTRLADSFRPLAASPAERHGNAIVQSR